jgi:hypothetical protein
MSKLKEVATALMWSAIIVTFALIVMDVVVTMLRGFHA